MHEIIPAILPKDEEELKEKLAQLPSEITFFHMDVLEKDIWTEVSRDFEVHLMVGEPEKIMQRWIDRGAKRISVHTAGNALAQFRGQAEIGLAVELEKPLEEVLPFLDFVDFVHLMSIDDLGHQGDTFEPIIFDRIKTVKEKFPNIPISIDGGIKLNNYQKLIDVGVSRLIVGSGFLELWNSLKKN
jgi:ribulose-phosphate 3-epimerase